MYCTKCGAVLDDGVSICPACGEDQNKEVQAQEVKENAPYKEARKFSGMAIAGFVLSLVGLLVFALPCGILGLVFSGFGMNMTMSKGYRGKGLAISGLVISIIDVVFGIVAIASGTMLFTMFR